ncbi:MAG: site-2 protease family protein [Clostridia bacterium]|nr:site-2 protease family protein [Clostridia bacterium]MBQ5800599.1 site-2 protease family protein [Clostridia bacterium]
MKLLNILLAVFIFGILIFIHEFGHYITARIFGVTIKEFSIGMGPKMITYTSKKTNIKYSLGILPIGGYVSMVGEDEESDDENALSKKPAWQRFIITVAGASMNIIAGALVMLVLISATPESMYSTTVDRIISVEEVPRENSSEFGGLMAGDKIVAVNGKKVHILSELDYEIMRRGIDTVALTVERNGEKKTLEVDFPVYVERGQYLGARDFYTEKESHGFSSVMKHSFYRSVLTVRMIWESLFDLVTGRFGIEAVSGPVGVTTQISEAASTGAANIIYLAIVISINLGVVNLLPFPALDGGRTVFILLEMIRRKPVPVKYEGMVHFIGIIILMAFMLIITLKDIITLF